MDLTRQSTLYSFVLPRLRSVPLQYTSYGKYILALVVVVVVVVVVKVIVVVMAMEAIVAMWMVDGDGCGCWFSCCVGEAGSPK